MTSRQPIDFAQRLQALDPTRSFICEAPAGSGKTELLTQRVLTLLTRVKQPEAILAITFTRKAAAEMRQRILSALYSGRGSQPLSEHAQTTWRLARDVLALDERFNWQLLDNPNRLQIRTFDSLCAYLTQTLPLHSSLGANIGASDQSERLYQAAVRQLMQSIEQDVTWADHLAFILGHLDNQQPRLEALLIAMLKARDSWIPVFNPNLLGADVRCILEGYFAEVLNDQCQQLKRLLPESIKTDLLTLAGYAAEQLKRENIASDIRELQDIDRQYSWPDSADAGVLQWRGIKALLLTQSGEFRRSLDKRCGFPAGSGKAEKLVCKQQKEKMQAVLALLEDVPGLLLALRNIASWPARVYQDQQWRVLESLTHILPVLLAHLRLVFAAEGEVDFIEVSERARLALGSEDNPTELALRLDHRIEHILVDEFQDTSFSQVDLLTKLTMGWQPDDGRTLFCVGDAMQSIYSFRGAKVGLFLHCRENGLGDIVLNKLQLSTNFRSQANVVHWLNRVFKSAFPPLNDISAGAVCYSTAEDFREASPGDAVNVHFYRADCDAGREGLAIVELIKQSWLANSEAQIAILLRNRNHGQSVVRALNQAGMRYRAVDLVPLVDQELIQDVFALTKALLNPMDRLSWFAILRAPWCGLTLTDLDGLSSSNGRTANEPLLATIRKFLLQPSSSLSADGRERLQRFFQVVSVGIGERERKPLRQWVEGVWLQLGGALCFRAANDRDNVERFWQMLQRLGALGEIPTIATMESALSGLFAAPDPAADPRLHIMTIHKSKGLEFDVVIVPGLHRRPRSKEAELLLWHERINQRGQEQWLLAPISAVGENKDPIYRYVEEQQKQRQHYEACRLLYVACTRAKQYLHLLAEVKTKEGSDQLQEPSAGSLIRYIWQEVGGSGKWLNDEEMSSASGHEGGTHAFPIRRLPSHWSMPAFPTNNLLQAFVLEHEFYNQNVSSVAFVSTNEQLPRYVGTLVHAILQLIGMQGLDRWSAQDLITYSVGWCKRLESMGVASEVARQQLPNILTMIATVLHDERFRSLLSHAARRECEYAVTLYENNRLDHMVIDLVCELKDGTTLIVDYKTSQPKAGQTLQAFLQQEEAQYRETLARYSRALENVGHKYVKSALFFVMIGYWHDL